MQKWQHQLNAAAFTPESDPKEDWPFQVHLVSSEDMMQWLQSGSRSQIDLNGVEIERFGFINEPYRAFYGSVSGIKLLTGGRCMELDCLLKT
ncbi:hypothetical protein PCI56_09245 [Plesiomonas shigelloides subsp. oncorhynchi]|nr:hypothetical protein [Plesiomonas shigelloides]